MRSTTQTDFTPVESHIRAQDMEALDKLESIGKSAANAGRRLQSAVARLDSKAIQQELYMLSSLGSTVNSWSGPAQ